MAQKPWYENEREAVLRLLGLEDDPSIPLSELRMLTGYGANTNRAAQPNINTIWTSAGTKQRVDSTVSELLQEPSQSYAAMRTLTDVAVAEDLTTPGTQISQVLRAATVEELTQSLLVKHGEVAHNDEYAFYTALFPCRLDQISLVAAKSVTADSTNFWRVWITTYRNGVKTPVVNKHTGAVSGEGITAFKGWAFDLNNFNPEAQILNKGDVLTIRFEQGNSPEPLDTPVLTFRVVPVDSGVVPPPIPETFVLDTFNRADAGSLGTPDIGPAWDLSTNWEIVNGAAESTGVASARIETGHSDCTITAKILSHGSGSTGISFRSVDSNNEWGVTPSYAFKRVGGVLTNLATFTPSALTNDVMRVVLRGPDIEIWVDDGDTGVFVHAITYTDSFNQSATRHGLRASAAGARIDYFEVTENV